MYTPVVLIIFNRPDTTERVFTEIARAKPSTLLVVADGPRPDRPGDAEKCAAARAIIERVDWECDVLKNYAEVNLGCGHRPATGISWVFEQVEEAIILEDDCVPHPTFFRFCEELLEKYRNDERVMMIGGTGLLIQNQTPYSYHFSRIPACWGWATWRRAWRHFDFEIKLWPELRNTPWLLDLLGDSIAVEFWQNIYDGAYAGRGNVDYWDHQWTFTCWVQNGLMILPNVNLISNMGFGRDATHTKNANDICANAPTVEMKFPLRHPPYIVRDRETDQARIEVSPEVKQLQGQRRLCYLLRQKISAATPNALRRIISHFGPTRIDSDLTDE